MSYDDDLDHAQELLMRVDPDTLNATGQITWAHAVATLNLVGQLDTVGRQVKDLSDRVLELYGELKHKRG